jgi:hypothetical protein
VPKVLRNAGQVPGNGAMVLGKPRRTRPSYLLTIEWFRGFAQRSEIRHQALLWRGLCHPSSPQIGYWSQLGANAAGAAAPAPSARPKPLQFPQLAFTRPPHRGMTGQRPGRQTSRAPRYNTGNSQNTASFRSDSVDISERRGRLGSPSPGCPSLVRLLRVGRAFRDTRASRWTQASVDSGVPGTHRGEGETNDESEASCPDDSDRVCCPMWLGRTGTCPARLHALSSDVEPLLRALPARFGPLGHVPQLLSAPSAAARYAVAAVRRPSEATSQHLLLTGADFSGLRGPTVGRCASDGHGQRLHELFALLSRAAPGWWSPLRRFPAATAWASVPGRP